MIDDRGGPARPAAPRRGTSLALRAMLLITLVGTAACGRVSELWHREALSEVEPLPPPALQDTIYRGTLIFGDSVRAFTPCGETRALWVEDQTQGVLGKIHAELAGDGGSGVYVELRGLVEAAPAAKAALGYDGLLRATELVRATPMRESRACDDSLLGLQYRAGGNEPFWSVEIGQQGIVFRQPEEPNLVYFSPVLPQVEAGRLIFSSLSRDADQQRIAIALEPKPCRDSMSGAYTSWTATVEFGGRTLHGCAMQGWID